MVADAVGAGSRRSDSTAGQMHRIYSIPSGPRSCTSSVWRSSTGCYPPGSCTRVVSRIGTSSACSRGTRAVLWRQHPQCSARQLHQANVSPSSASCVWRSGG